MEAVEIAYNLPLIELFNQLRRAGLPLGVNEYQLVIHALQGGFGISDRRALARLCKTLWAKSPEDERIFDYHFNRTIEQLTAIVDQAVTGASMHQRNDSTKETQKASKEQRKDISLPQDLPPSPGLAKPESTSTSLPSLREKDDDAQVASAILQSAQTSDIFADNYFSQAIEYFPITRRQMKQSWRYLRYPVREGPLVEVDIHATISDIGQRGMFLTPILVPQRKNRAELFLFIDQGGSMVPFHALSRHLVDTALRGGRLGQANTYYFHNCPDEYLYQDPTRREAKALKEILAKLHYKHTGILIVSDAGAARGSFDPERIKLTADFLHALQPYVRSVAWLNPMPQERWKDTSASVLQRLVPMFDISRRGLDSAIRVLRGGATSTTQSEERMEDRDERS